MNRTNTTNATTPTAFVAASVPSIGICRIVILISRFVLNSIVLSVYIARRKMRTPFSVYIMSLLTSNLLDLILFFPFMIANNLGTDASHFVFGETGCAVYGYGVAIMRCCCLASHALITLNRAWAMTFPISYKNIHSSRFAVALCVVVMVGIHSLMVPGLVLSEQTRPRPVQTYGCWYQVSRSKSILNLLSTIGFFLFYIMPVIIVAMYPYLFFKYLQAKKRVAGQEGHQGAPAELKASRTFGIVSMLSLSIIVCWLPEELVTLLMSYVGSRSVIRAYPIVSLLSSFQVLLDPLFLLVSSRELRYGLMSILCNKKFMAERAGTFNMVTFARSNTKHPTMSTRIYN
ncbi:melanopsin-A-like [Paramacrobiotus metropolitanus]|uniref:melanopsin-A-like n=1 Tax=Paramacrobiotus metropolitanus TaxID=2943436 RepID=UPI002445C5EE|nr:melanopsin-A-like [Paramacrobiotus metropolitanus]XP_055349829.1 melanopsin-A-like [Paramacrobiotus metropolitanus]XP_055349830.1 melanopsin-A-like [Paramacrobiotus metropolitanus]XP_055349831.1 melanopsin-A-like [Paramacrobiotus metropolitanus]XP_055349832.1 melanopsin-A-like [Paramacrobiotus metropolitanus]